MEPKEAIERVVIASSVLATSLIPRNSEVKASYYKEDIPSCSITLPQKESAAEQELSPNQIIVKYLAKGMIRCLLISLIGIHFSQTLQLVHKNLQR